MERHVSVAEPGLCRFLPVMQWHWPACVYKFCSGKTGLFDMCVVAVENFFRRRERRNYCLDRLQDRIIFGIGFNRQSNRLLKRVGYSGGNVSSK